MHGVTRKPLELINLSVAKNLSCIPTSVEGALSEIENEIDPHRALSYMTVSCVTVFYCAPAI